MNNKTWILNQEFQNTFPEKMHKEKSIARDALIEKVGDFIIEHAASTRIAAKQHNISHATVLAYLECYTELHPNKKELLDAIKNFNKSLTNMTGELLKVADFDIYYEAKSIEEKLEKIKFLQQKAENEFLRRINLVGEYIDLNGASYRETAKYFSTNHFRVSHTTVASYYEKYRNLGKEQNETNRKMH